MLSIIFHYIMSFYQLHETTNQNFLLCTIALLLLKNTNNVHLPEADGVVVVSLKSAFPMVNNGWEPPFIVFTL